MRYKKEIIVNAWSYKEFNDNYNAIINSALVDYRRCRLYSDEAMVCLVDNIKNGFGSYGWFRKDHYLVVIGDIYEIILSEVFNKTYVKVEPTCYCTLSGKPNYGSVVCEICDNHLTETMKDGVTEETKTRMEYDRIVDAKQQTIDWCNDGNAVINENTVYITNEQEHSDGSMTMNITMPSEMIKHFASVGVSKIIKDAADNILNGRDDPYYV